jgi:hypothetical protein
MRTILLVLVAASAASCAHTQEAGRCGASPPRLPPPALVYLDIVGPPRDSSIVRDAAEDELREAGVAIGDQDTYTLRLTLTVADAAGPVFASATTLSSRSRCAVSTEDGTARMSDCDALIGARLRISDGSTLATVVREEIVEIVAIMDDLYVRALETRESDLDCVGRKGDVE